MTTLASAAAVALTLAAVPVATYVVPACTPFGASTSLAGASDGGRSTCWPRRANAVAGQRPTPTGSRLHTGMHMSGRLGSSGYPDLAFDYESAAERGSDDVAPEQRVAEMLQILRDEALPYLEEPMLRAQMQKHVLSRYSLAEVVASILAAKLASSDLSEAQLFETLLGVMRKRPQLVSRVAGVVQVAMLLTSFWAIVAELREGPGVVSRGGPCDGGLLAAAFLLQGHASGAAAENLPPALALGRSLE